MARGAGAWLGLHVNPGELLVRLHTVLFSFRQLFSRLYHIRLWCSSTLQGHHVN